MSGLSTTGNISLGCALVAGRNRVPSPAAGRTALRTRCIFSVISSFSSPSYLTCRQHLKSIHPIPESQRNLNPRERDGGQPSKTHLSCQASEFAKNLKF